MLCVLAPEPGQYLSTIKSLSERLADIIEPDFGLLDQLLRLQVLNRRQLADVRGERTVCRRNDTLLDLLSTDDQCNKCLTALQNTDQQHVVNYIKQNGGLTRSYFA